MPQKKGAKRWFQVKLSTRNTSGITGVHPGTNRFGSRVWVARWKDYQRGYYRNVTRSVAKWGEEGARDEVSRIRNKALRQVRKQKIRTSVYIVRLDGERCHGWQLRWREMIGGVVTPQSKFFSDGRFGSSAAARRAAETCRHQAIALLTAADDGRA